MFTPRSIEVVAGDVFDVEALHSPTILGHVARIGAEPTQILEQLRPLAELADCGLIPFEDFEGHYARLMQLEEGNHLVADLSPITATHGLIHHLRHRGVPYCRVTNVARGVLQRVRTERPDVLCPAEGVVDIESNQIGVSKPNVGFYRHALEVMGVKPERMLTIDDSVANLTAAATLGINTFRFDPHDPDGSVAALYAQYPELAED